MMRMILLYTLAALSAGAQVTTDATALYRAAADQLNRGEDAKAETTVAAAKRQEVPFQRNRMTVKAMSQTPPGAGGWICSEAWQTGGARAFKPYDQAAQALLIADATAERLPVAAKSLKPYLESTAIHAAYDIDGLHFFIVSGEPELDQYRLLNTGAGALECFLSPGMEKVGYYQWIIDLPDNKVATYDKDSLHRAWRDLPAAMKSETLCRDGKMGTYLFLPWELFYDLLPFDTGSDWRFNVIRWTPAGGITWGGRVHELGRMGKLAFERNAELESAIRARLDRQAVARYQRTRKQLDDQWQDPELGDPVFYRAALAPAFARLDKAIEDGNIAEVRSDLMETEFLAQELRRDYLQKQLTQE